MLSEQLKEQIKRELPQWLRGDPEFRRFVLDLARDEFADKQQTEGRFEAMLAELARDREEQSRRWEAQERKWEANERKWEEETRAWRKHEEEVWAEIRNLREENVALDHRIDRTLGALGARWGLQSERAFRNALAGILEASFGVEVLHINEYDDAGEVFGRPEQVELDVIIKNGLLIICELKSSIDKAAMYSFERKARFYEKRHGRTASRLMVISPMIDPRAQKVAERLGIETYSDSLDVETLDGNAEGVSASHER
ncbi:MAG: DUF3782 domain-containing protein [Gammaproteobacteria bacterium]|jgi:hypothetical protein|nr:DUF3782 domain-containing protein [Gammaproteobacteria bacterium]